MMMNTTLDQLRQLKLVSMAQALQEQMQQSGISAMSFEERLAVLVAREVHGRQDRRCALGDRHAAPMHNRAKTCPLRSDP